MRLADRFAHWIYRALGVSFPSRAAHRSAVEDLSPNRRTLLAAAFSVVLYALGLVFSVGALVFEPAIIGKTDPLSILRTGVLYALLAFFFLKLVLSARTFYLAAFACDDEDEDF